MPGEKSDVFNNFEEFREWAENKNNWLLLIYDPNSSLFLTPLGSLVRVTVDDDEFVTYAMLEKEK